MIRVAKLRHDVRTTLAVAQIQNSVITRRKLQDLAEESQGIDNGLTMWILQAPDEWQFLIAGTPEVYEDTRQGFCSDILPHYYKSVGHAAIWNQYRALRLLVNDMYIQMAEASAKTDYAFAAYELSLARGRMMKLSKDLCDAVSSQIRQMKKSQAERPLEHSAELERMTPVAYAAGLLAWPLAAGSCLATLPDQQRRCIRYYLSTIAQFLGDRILETIAEGNIRI